MNSEPIITCHRGRGPFHVVCLPGLVPDGPETFARQRSLLKRHGSLSIVTYPYERFDLDRVLEVVTERLAQVRASGEVPVLLGVSVGGGLCLELLRRERDAGRPPRLGAVVLISPLSCTGDLAPLIKRLFDPILAASDLPDGRPELALERGRAFFQSLARGTRGFSGSGGKGSRRITPPWLGALSLLTPDGRSAWHQDRLRQRIECTLAALPARGAVDRVVSLRRLGGIAAKPGSDRAGGVLCTAPTLILWGSKERHTLSMDGPGTAVLTRPDLASRVFSDVQVQWVYDRDGGEVPHAALIKHKHAFNDHLQRFLGHERQKIDRRRRRAQRRAIFGLLRGRGLDKAG